MINIQDILTLKSMVDIFSISGQENKLSVYLEDQIRKISFYSPIDLKTISHTIDKFNNVVVKVKGQTDDIIMLDAHLDQIGFVISGISDEGMLRCYRIGGTSKQIIEAREFIVLTSTEKIPCIANKKHVHLIHDEKKEMPKFTYDIEFDIGCTSKEEAEKLVEIGDYIGYKPAFDQLKNNLIYGTALDDKIGCFMLLKIFYNIVNSPFIPKNTLIFSFSAQEETGITRLKNLIKKYNPKKIIEFDVTFASDYESVNEREVGECSLGNGMVLYVGNLIDKEIQDKIIKISKTNNLKLQKQVLNGAGGYNSDAVYELGEEADVTIMGIPLRNMHSPVEICSMDDVYSGITLITKLFLNEDQYSAYTTI
jgi:endoglucanase